MNPGKAPVNFRKKHYHFAASWPLSVTWPIQLSISSAIGHSVL